MATTRLMPLHTGKGRTVGQAISDIIDYTENPQKTDGGRLITSWQCDSRIADAEFLFTKNQYIVQRRSAANTLREPAPLTVADSQGVVLFGAVGVSGYMDELLWFIIAEVSQKVHFLGLGNILRSNIAHRASPRFAPVSQKIGSDDRIGSALDGVSDVVHVVGLPLFEVLEHIRKGPGRLQERLALLIG